VFERFLSQGNLLYQRLPYLHVMSYLDSAGKHRRCAPLPSRRAFTLEPSYTLLQRLTVNITMATPGNLAKSGTAINEKLTAGAKPSDSTVLLFLPLEVRGQITRYAAGTDEVLVRLERFFTSTANIETLLAPLQYSACLFSYLQKDLHARSASTAAALNDVVGSWRNTLRLLQIPVLYTLLRQLLSEAVSARGDMLVWRINVAQCVLYLTYQFLENIAHLVELGVFSSSTVPVPLYRDQTTLWLHSNRFWLLGISCDLLRLAREAQLQRSRRQVSSSGEGNDAKVSPEQEKAETTRWWHELTTAGCTWPLCLHWSLENGLSKFNDGVIGVLGILASYESLRQRWEETKR
jgi:hypothetical protein